MPRGFIGLPAKLYLTQASEAHSRALSQGNQVVAVAPSNSQVRDRRFPFEPTEGASGGFVATGRGNSSNIVVSQGGYIALSQRASQADDRIGECLYNIAIEIENLCQTSFILPDAVPKCLNVSESVKRTLGEFRSLTEETVLLIRGFAREIDDIG